MSIQCVLVRQGSIPDTHNLKLERSVRHNEHCLDIYSREIDSTPLSYEVYGHLSINDVVWRRVLFVMLNVHPKEPYRTDRFFEGVLPDCIRWVEDTFLYEMQGYNSIFTACVLMGQQVLSSMGDMAANMFEVRQRHYLQEDVANVTIVDDYSEENPLTSGEATITRDDKEVSDLSIWYDALPPLNDEED